MANENETLLQSYIDILGRQVISCQGRISELAFSKEAGARDEMYKIKGRMDQAKEDIDLLGRLRSIAIKADKYEQIDKRYVGT